MKSRQRSHFIREAQIEKADIKSGFIANKRRTSFIIYNSSFEIKRMVPKNIGMMIYRSKHFFF